MTQKPIFMFINTVFAATLAFAGGHYYQVDESKISQLDLYKQFDENYFSKPQFPSSDVILAVDSEEKEKLGLFQISLMNYTTEDYSDIPIQIKITPKNPSEFKILAHSAFGQNKIADLVESTKDMDFDGSSYNFSYKVSYINRAQEYEYGMRLRILFEGTEQPGVEVVARGVGIRDFDVKNSPYQRSMFIKNIIKSLSYTFILVLLLGLFVALILHPLTSRFTKNSMVKSHKKYAQSIYSVIKNNDLMPNKSDENIANLVTEILYHHQCKWWNSKPLIVQWTYGLREPDRNDHLVEV